MQENDNNYGLETLRSENEIKTYPHLVSSLAEDERNSSPEIAEMIKNIRKNLNPKDFEHTWGVSSERNRVCIVINELRIKLRQLPKDNNKETNGEKPRNFILGGY